MSRELNAQELAELRQMRNDGARWTECGDRFGMSRDAARRAYSRAVGAPAPSGEDVTNPTLLRLERDNVVLTEKLAQAKKKLKATHRDTALFEGLAAIIRQETRPLSGVRILPREQSASTEDGRTPVDAVLLLSDEHADQVIDPAIVSGLEDYDFGIFRCRLQRLAEVVVDYVTVHLPAHRFERLWVFKLGDGVNGDIHDHGPRNHFANTVKAAIALGDVEAQFIQAVLPSFPGGVHVVGVSGNHPRRTTRKDYEGPHDNFDYLVGVQMAARLRPEIEAGRVSVTLPNSFSAYVEVRNRIWALNHGDDVKGYSGIPWVGFDKRNNRVQSILAQQAIRADFFAYGHYHTPASFASAGGQSLHSGAWSLVDPYAFGKLALGGNEPTQTLYTVDDQRGIILPVPIYTRDRKREAAFRKGRYNPELGRELVIDQVTPEVKVEPGVAVIRRPEAA
jgi:hypothetical protein